MVRSEKGIVKTGLQKPEKGITETRKGDYGNPKRGSRKPEKGITQTRKGDYEDPKRGSRKSEIRITENGITENYITEMQRSELLKCVRMISPNVFLRASCGFLSVDWSTINS